MSDDKAELGGGASGSSGTRRQCYESGTLNIYTNTFGMIPFAISTPTVPTLSGAMRHRR